MIRSSSIVASLCALLIATSCASDKAAEGSTTETVTAAPVELGPIATHMASLEQPPEFVDFFAGTFTTLGIELTDADEKFTVTHTGDKLVLTGGIQGEVDFLVPVKIQNMKNLEQHAADGKLDEHEAFRIMSVMFSPLTQQNLKHPMWQNETVLNLSGIEKTMHVSLLDEEGAEAAQHTLIFKDEKWTVTEGLTGEAERTFRMNATQALEFQRKSFEAIKKDDLATWSSFAGWYKEWRETVSTTADATG